jgi:hypothetical protein
MRVVRLGYSVSSTTRFFSVTKSTLTKKCSFGHRLFADKFW